MPHFTLQISTHGASMNALIGVSEGRGKALTDLGQPIPNLVKVTALLDTGASATCIDPSVLQVLGLTPTGQVMIRTPSTGNNPVSFDQYDVSMLVPPASANQVPLYIGTLPVVCTELLVSQGFHVLVGRDILAHCLFIYNGSTNLFTLSY
jgi:Aspartyl protease